MKKRLRKKKHKGEFKIYGVPLAIKRNNKTDFDSFFDEFLEQAIEANGCFCGGGGKENTVNVFIELGRKDNKPEMSLEKIISWLKSRPDIDKWYLGQVIDANYGPFDEMDEISKKNLTGGFTRTARTTRPVSHGVLSQNMTRFTKLFLLIVILCASCNAQVDMNEFDFNKSEFVMLNNTELNANQTEKLEMALNKLKKRKKEIYSKPAHQINFKINGEIRYISIFGKENFVFNGYFLEAWTDRMEGKKSNGYKLSNDLKELIKEIDPKTEPLPSADRKDRAPAEAGR